MSVTRLFPVLTLSAALLAPLAVAAQTPPAPAAVTSGAPPAAASHHGHRHRHRRSLIHALHAVNLSAGQKQQIATFRAQEKQANLNADPATKRANAAKLRQQVMGILTPDQKTQLSTEMHRSNPQTPIAAPVPSPAASPGTK